MLPIWKLGGQIDEGAATKVRIRDLLSDAFEQRFDLFARRIGMTICGLVPPLPESPILLIGKGRDQFFLGGKGSI